MSKFEDSLGTIFRLQAELNDHVFVNNNLRDEKGDPITMALLREAVGKERFGVNDLPNQWLVRYAKAMEEELGELKEDLLWKWWSKDSIDIQNIRVELVDILHFLVSAMIASGLTAEKVLDLYEQKHAVNRARQDSGYSKANKNEEDNRSIR
jgi:dimeric dUTPase (all-alpha-NTP-PPase superfamily)